MEEIGCALSSYFNITWEEKYGIIETDSKRERCKKIEEAVYEFMEVFQVGEEAEEAQKEIHEQVYRESAIKKQIELLQQQLDEMHPENISDVRKFETKIAQSGMNEEARKEAEKVLNRMKQEGKDSHEYGMLYDYLDFVTSLSWKTEEQTEINLQEAEEILDEDIEKLIEERQAARKAKDFARADAIRDELLEKGIILKDTREGVQWKRA